MKLLTPPAPPAGATRRKVRREPIGAVIVAAGDAAPLWRTLQAFADGASTAVFAPDHGFTERVAQLEPEVVLLHSGAASEASLGALRALTRRLPAVPVVLVAADAGYANIAAAFRAGASGYLLESASEAELRQALLMLRAGGAPMSPGVARQLVESFRPKPGATRLTPREEEVLGWVAAGLVNKEIAQRLQISVETVRHHLKQIYPKLGVGTRTQAAMEYCRSKGPAARVHAPPPEL